MCTEIFNQIEEVINNEIKRVTLNKLNEAITSLLMIKRYVQIIREQKEQEYLVINMKNCERKP